MQNELNGKVAFVTGAGAGIGKGVAMGLSKRGAIVYAVGRNVEKLEELAREAQSYGNNIHSLVADVSDREQINGAVEIVSARHGRVDIAINNAGVMYLAPIKENDWSDGITMVHTNLVGTLNVIHAVLPGMLKRGEGDILNFSSISARMTGPGTAVYGATKCAIEVISESMRQELAGTGVRVGCLQLGGVATGLNDKIHNKEMRRFIKMRGKGYHDLPVESVVGEVIHMLTRPRYMHVASTFLLSSDQAS